MIGNRLARGCIFANGSRREQDDYSASAHIQMKSFAIAVHAGAGNHPPRREREVLSLLRRSLRAAEEVIADGGNAVEAGAAAVAILEDSPYTNAGIGSSLNFDGEVECDAAVMDGTSATDFGIVTGVEGVRNPCRAAALLLHKKVNSKSICGMVHPGILCGAGAKKFCVENGLEMADLKTPRKVRRWQEYRDLLQRTKEAEHNKSSLDADAHENIETVGAVCVTGEDDAACSLASSGGSWLKPEGRVGAAGSFGSACYACGRQAVAVSGQGEALISSMVAYQIAQKQNEDSSGYTSDASDGNDSQESNLFEDPIATILDGKNAGAIYIEASSRGRATVSWTHSSKSLALGYFSSGMNKPIAFVSRRRGVTGGATVDM